MDEQQDEYTGRAGEFGGMLLDFSGVAATAEDVFGSEELTPGEMVKRLWTYARAHGLVRKV
ncbi:MAG: hypothetical protein ACRDHF_14105 [Tepidiformaceae bacterium]